MKTNPKSEIRIPKEVRNPKSDFPQPSGFGLRTSFGFRPSAFGFICLLFCVLCSSFGQTTQVLFPINSLFGGAAYNKPITISAANTLITDGQNLWAGTYTIVPASITNPIVNLYPNTYLMKVAGVVKPARFVVPASAGTNVLDVTTLLTSGPIFYFGGSGLANLLAGTNIVFITNSDSSITINWGGNSLLPQVITNASYATNAGTSLVSGFSTNAQTAAFATNATFAQFATIASLAQLYLGNLGVAQITNLPPYLTNGTTGATLFGTFNGTHAGDGSGLTNLNARSLLVSNLFSIYPHLTGTNVFWSTIP